MSLHMRQNENRSELQKRLDAELRAKAAERNKIEAERPDGVSDSSFIERTSQAGKFAWVWLAVFLLAVAVFVFIVYRANTV